jgi:glutaredoxin
MITVYGGKNCSACDGVKSALNADKIEYEYVDVFDPEIAQEHKDTFFGEHNFRSIPQIFVDKEHVGSVSAVNNIISKARESHEQSDRG